MIFRLPRWSIVAILDNQDHDGMIRERRAFRIVLGWRNRKTQWTQNPPPARVCEFDSRSEHQEITKDLANS